VCEREEDDQLTPRSIIPEKTKLILGVDVARSTVIVVRDAQSQGTRCVQSVRFPVGVV
jgi:hypothetical protein